MPMIRKYSGLALAALLAIVSFSCHDPEIADSSQPRVQIAVSSTDIGFTGVESGKTMDQNFTITNSFGFARPLHVTLSVTGTGFAVVGGTGSFTLDPGASRTITVRFSPSAGGSYSGSLIITHDGLNVSNPITIPLRGNASGTSNGGGGGGGGTGLSITPSSLDFGTLQSGQSSIRTVVIVNTSSSATSVSGSITLSGQDYSFVTGSGQFTLASGKSLGVTIKFAPSSSGTETGTLTITHNSTEIASPITIPLTGTGRLPTSTKIEISRTSINFGTVPLGSNPEQSLTITNPSTSTDAVGVNIGITGGQFVISSGVSSFTLSPGTSQTITIRFTANASGTYTGSLLISHTATGTFSPLSVSIRADIASSIILSITPLSLSFGTVTLGQTSDQSFTITNSLNSTGALSGSVGLNGQGFSILTGGGFYSLSPGQSRTVTVRFSPSASVSYAGSVTISHNGTSTASPVSIALSGTGQEGSTGGGGGSTSITVSPTVVDYGTIGANTTLDAIVTIQNTSSSGISGSVMLKIDGTGFSIVSGGGSYSLSAGQTRTVKVRFSPYVAGNYAQTLAIYHNASGTENPVNVHLQGIAN